MDSRQEMQFDLTKTLQIILRRKWLILVTLFLVVLFVTVFNELSTPIFKASTTIVFEELNSPSASISPFKISFNKNFIIKQIEEIKSNSLAMEIFKALPEDIIKTFPIPKTVKPGFDKLEYIVKEIRDRISASSINESEVIKIEVEAYTALAAEVIANTITDVLKDRKLAIKREETSKVREIIEEQLITFKEQLDKAETALKNFKEKSEVTVIDKEAEEIFKRITESEVAYNQAKANLDAAKKRFKYIKDKLAKERNDLVPSITKVTSPWAQKLKQELVDLEVQYTTLKLQDYSENHPKMVELKRQISEAKDNLKNEALKIAAGENIIDPISQIQKLMEESITLEIEIQTYQAQEKTLGNVIINYKRSLNTLPDKELRLAQFLRDKEVNEKIYTMLMQKREEAKIAEAEKVGNIRIIDPAILPRSPVKPRKALNLIIGIIFGLVSSISLTFLLEYLDKNVKNTEEVEQFTDLKVLGIVPKIDIKPLLSTNFNREKDRRSTEIILKLIAMYNPRSLESEIFRHLMRNLQLTKINSPLKTILITSANPGEGKSLIISNLSIIAARMGLKTLLVDADLKKPVLHKVFQKENKLGLTDLLSTRSNSNGIYETISSTTITNLDILLCGTIPVSSSEIIASPVIKEILVKVKNRYDIVFIDTPPINIVVDAGILNLLVDGSVLVVRANRTSINEMKNAIKLLRKAQDNILGIILNVKNLNDRYSKNYYHYYGDESNRTERREKNRNIPNYSRMSRLAVKTIKQLKRLGE